MRILIIGSDKISSIENFYRRHLAALGFEVSVFLAPNLFYDFYNQGLVNKLLFRMGFSSIYKRINSKLKQIVDLEKPKLVWVFKGMEIYPETLDWIRSKGIKLVNYNPDNPFLFSGRGSGNRNITKSIDKYDLHFTYNLSVKERLEKTHQAKVYFLPFGFEIDQDLYEHCSAQSEELIVCFLGNPDKERVRFIHELADCEIKIHVYGHNWNKFINHPNVRTEDAVYGIRQWEVLQGYRVQLNLMRLHNHDSHNMRTFEVPAIGGIMLAPLTREHQMFYKDRKEVFLYEGITDCVMMIKYILGLNYSQAEEIRSNARVRSLTSGYSYHDRAKEVAVQFEKLQYE